MQNALDLMFALCNTNLNETETSMSKTTSKEILEQIGALIDRLESIEASRMGYTLEDELIGLRDAIDSYEAGYDSRAENYEPETRADRSAEQAYKESREMVL
jgi:hypothetical protein